jgi:hypothetical protein
MEAYGTMECWNNGIIGLKNENFLHSCCPSISEHIVPIFQYSNWGRAPDLVLFKYMSTKGLKKC